jgi:DNA-binding MarR family transcriptional regulator
VPESPRRLLLDLYVAYQLAGSLIEHELADSGLAAEDFALYSALRHHGQLTPTELARELGLPLSTVIFRTGKLVAGGHVERIPNLRDRRSTLLRLTAAGQGLVDEAFPLFGRVLDRLEAHLEEPLADMRESLAALSDALARALGEARDEELLRTRRAS